MICMSEQYPSVKTPSERYRHSTASARKAALQASATMTPELISLIDRWSGVSVASFSSMISSHTFVFPQDTPVVIRLGHIYAQHGEVSVNQRVSASRVDLFDQRCVA